MGVGEGTWVLGHQLGQQCVQLVRVHVRNAGQGGPLHHSATSDDAVGEGAQLIGGLLGEAQPGITLLRAQATTTTTTKNLEPVPRPRTARQA